MEDKSKVRLLITFLRDFLTKHTFKADIEFPEVQRVVVENQQEIVIPTSITVDNLEEVIEGAKGLSTEVIQAIEAGLKTLAKELKPEKAEKLGIKLEAIKKILDRPMKQADVLGALKKLESVIKDKELNIDLKPVLKKLDSFNFDPLEKYIKYGAVKTRLDDKQFEKLLDAFKTIPTVVSGGGSSGGSTDVSALALEATLSSIKDTDGIKKITDPVDTELPAAAALADNTANPTAPAVGSFPHGWDGSTWDRLRTVAGLGDGGTAALAIGIYGYNDTTWDRLRSDTTNGLDVDVTRLPALPAGTNAIGKVIQSNVLIPADYDYISLSYTGSNLTGVVFKTGGSGGTTVGTLTLAYTGSNLTSVTKT